MYLEVMHNDFFFALRRFICIRCFRLLDASTRYQHLGSRRGRRPTGGVARGGGGPAEEARWRLVALGGEWQYIRK